MADRRTINRKEIPWRRMLIIFLLVLMLGTLYLKYSNGWKVIAVDERGAPVKGVEVYVTYPSSPKAEMFRTNEKGVAIIQPSSKAGIASLSFHHQGKKGGITWSDVQWPVQVRVGERDILMIGR